MNIKYKITCLIFVPFSVWKNLVSEREREAVFQTVGAELEEADGQGDGVGGAEVRGPGQQLSLLVPGLEHFLFISALSPAAETL